MSIFNKFKEFLSDPEIDEYGEVVDDMDFVSKTSDRNRRILYLKISAAIK